MMERLSSNGRFAMSTSVRTGEPNERRRGTDRAGTGQQRQQQRRAPSLFFDRRLERTLSDPILIQHTSKVLCLCVDENEWECDTFSFLRRMRLPRDSGSVELASSSPSSIIGSHSSCKLVGNKENVQPEGGSVGAESSAAANLLWLLDFRLDNLLPNDGNISDKMANAHQGIRPPIYILVSESIQPK